jgi:hypothetical protein
VHIAKKFLLFEPEFSTVFSAPPEFSAGVTEKYFSTGCVFAWTRTFDLQITNQMLYHASTSFLIFLLLVRLLLSFVLLPCSYVLLLAPMLLQVFLICCCPYCYWLIHDLAQFCDVACVHAVADVSSVVSPTVTGVHALVFTHALAGTHAFVSVSAFVVGSSVAGIVSL